MTRWEDREPDLRAVLDELSRLWSRAGRRKGAVLLLTLLLVGFAAFREYRRQRTYPATIILSASEGENVYDGVSHASDKLNDYVYYAVFTDRALTELLEKYDFRPDLREKNPRLRLEQFRDFIDVTIFKNEFSQPRYVDTAPRSAHIAVEFRHTDPDTALAIARDLGELVISRDAENRRLRFESDARSAAEALSLANAEVNRFNRSLEQSRTALDDAPRTEQGTLRVAIDSDEKGIIEALARQKQAVDAKLLLDARKNANTQNLELKFERVDWGAPKVAINQPFAIARVAVLSFLGLFPAVALGVGAFGRNVYDDRDVTRLGLRSLGIVRRRAQR